jgi:dTDP-4-dehydrorhamnose reductase
MPGGEKVVNLALIGANGMLARKVLELAPVRYAVHGFDLPEFDLADERLVRTALTVLRPAVIVNCAAYTNVDGCESEADTAFRVNGEGPGVLARVAREIGATLVHISTDYVFSGEGSRPYREEDAPAPRSVYGRSKLAGEEAIAASGLERYFIVRTSWLYGPGGKNFVETMVRLAQEREELRVVADQVGSPTYTGDLAAALFSLLALEERGIAVPYGRYHFADQGSCSWHGFAEAIVAQARVCGEELRVQRVTPITTADYPLPAPRPAYSVFDTERYRRATGKAIPPWRESLEHYFLYDRKRS